jgi:hypothetical protein
MSEDNPFHDYEDRPLFHLDECTGLMTELVKKFLQDFHLDQSDLNHLRWYVHQWVAAMPHKPADFERIKIMRQDELKKYCYFLLFWGIDPF